MEQFGGCFMGGGEGFDNLWVEFEMFQDLMVVGDESTVRTVGSPSSF